MLLKRMLNHYKSKIAFWLIGLLAPAGQKQQLLDLAQLQRLESSDFLNADWKRLRDIVFDTDYSDISKLCRLISKARAALEANEKFEVSLLSTETTRISLEQFFTNTQQQYIYPDIAVAVFKQEGLAFLQAYAETPELDYGVENFNRRVLSKLYKSVINTAQALAEYSHTA